MSATKSISEKQAELDELLKWFDGDDFSIELVSEQFEKATRLAKSIEKDLMSAKNEINKLKERFDSGSRQA